MTPKPAPTQDLQEAKRDLLTHGYCLLEGALCASRLAQVRARLDCQALAERRVGVGYFEPPLDDDCASVSDPLTNQRVFSLMNKGTIFHDLVQHRTPLALIRWLFGQAYDDGTPKPEYLSDALLSSFTANIANKGGLSQRLHTDQLYAPVATPYPIVANVVWMLDDFTDENGATRIVPGSHLTPSSKIGQVSEMDTIPAEAPAGTAMVFDGRLWHGTGTNRTDRPRRALLAYYCRPFVRQQENYALSLKADIIRAASPELLKLLGFSVWTTLGGVEGAAHEAIMSRNLPKVGMSSTDQPDTMPDGDRVVRRPGGGLEWSDF